jgi:hypothetical protein
MRDLGAMIDAPASEQAGRRWCAVGLVLLGLVHGGLTLQLFGPDTPWTRMLDGDPVTSGRHRLFLEQSRRTLTSGVLDPRFDPSSYAGRPGSAVGDPTVPFFGLLRRSAAMRVHPAAFKLALATSYWLVPFGLAFAARFMGRDHGSAVAVAAVAVFVCWLRPAADWIENGDPCVAVVFTWASICWALLRRWHHAPSARSWCATVGGVALGWLTQPALWSAFLLILLFSWAFVLHEHGWRWNAAAALGLLVSAVEGLMMCGPRLPTWWENVWGHAPVGTNLMHEIAATAIWLAVIPTGQALGTAGHWFAGRRSAGFLVGSVGVLVAAALLVYRPAGGRWRNWWGPRPLMTGLPQEGLALERIVNTSAPVGARVLLEDLAGRPDLAWTALLARCCGRDFVGGSDPDGTLEHSACALRDGALAGRPLDGWTDADLDRYARRYNIGCIVCTTAAARERVRRWPTAAAVVRNGLADWEAFIVRRPHSFVLKGNIGTFVADDRRLTLADVAPEDGEIVLSLHYQPGWRVRPSTVRIERELDPYDPVPLVRLRTPGHVGRVTITWDGQ